MEWVFTNKFAALWKVFVGEKYMKYEINSAVPCNKRLQFSISDCSQASQIAFMAVLLYPVNITTRTFSSV